MLVEAGLLYVLRFGFNSSPDPQDLMITINSDMTVDEGAGAAVLCVDLDGLPSGGMEISVEVNISSMEDGAGKQ